MFFVVELLLLVSSILYARMICSHFIFKLEMIKPFVIDKLLNCEMGRKSHITFLGSNACTVYYELYNKYHGFGFDDATSRCVGSEFKFSFITYTIVNCVN